MHIPAALFDNCLGGGKAAVGKDTLYIWRKRLARCHKHGGGPHRDAAEDKVYPASEMLCGKLCPCNAVTMFIYTKSYNIAPAAAACALVNDKGISAYGKAALYASA